ncbi:hybrid sensor histidine kinase/response regulator [Desulfonatronovibrio hydrogenovorans]|uniref:hybrid sensor histidine kinase/response regulator n=1 Tax=Desulfonatronovibrio hydrogenovorans TaxID=53245 RepID=UPI00068B34B4|nr:PAS domain-containing sensor histidine kinase [Desulfonatronovibrio hydrogenovorans]
MPPHEQDLTTWLTERVSYLEDAYRSVLQSLQTAAEGGDFRPSAGQFHDQVDVLKDCALRVMRLAPFESVGFWVVDEETSDFSLGYFTPVEAEDFMTKEFDRLTDEGMVALALMGENPIYAAGSKPGYRHVIQVLATSSRVRGLLIGRLETGKVLSEAASPLLMITAQNCASSLEALELYGLLKDKNRDLKEQMQQLAARESQLKREIVNRKAVQARLEILAQAFINSLEGMLIIDSSGLILEANPAFCSMIRQSRDKIINRTFVDLLKWLRINGELKKIIQQVRAKGSFEGEIQARLHKGSALIHALVSVSISLDDSGRPDSYIVVVHDTTDRRNQEKALLEAEKRYREIFELAPVAIFRTTPDGRFLMVNPAYSTMLGFGSPQEMIRSVNDIGTQLYHDPAERIEYVRQLREKGMVDGFETRLKRQDGGLVWVSINSRTVLNEQGNILFIDGFLRDITAFKENEQQRYRAEQEREKLQNQLNQAQKMESIGRLAGGVAHDFNNMLQVILGYSRMAMARTSSDSPLVHPLEEIQKAADRSVDLARQLLAFARKQTIRPKVLNLNDTISDMMGMLQSLIGEHLILEWTPAPDLLLTRVDPSQIDQILVNLVINARDAISGQGSISIATKNFEMDESFCREHPECLAGDYVLLEVADSGCGMDEHVLSKMFEPFFTTKGLGVGTGLGLATVYGIVKQNNGYIYAHSRPGHGTVFSVYFPGIQGEQASFFGRKQAQQDLARGSGTVLLVEDEEMVLELTSEVLEQLGYTVLSSSSPTLALEKAKEYQGEIDLLVTDVNMPVMNGPELARKIRTVRPDIRVLFMSGYTSDLMRHQDLLCNETLFLQKPFSAEELSQKIRRVLDVSGQGRSA